MRFPVVIVTEGQVLRTVTAPEPFAGPDGTQHPANAWTAWTEADWAERCPGWSALPLLDIAPPPDPTKVITRRPETSWVITPDGVRVLYSVTDKPPDEVAAALAGLKATAASRVNHEAGEARARYITVAVGQEGTYLEKAREARAYLSDTAPDPIRYPYLSAEAECTGQTMDMVALLVTETSDAWTLVNAKIEGLRQGALVTIKNADTTAALAAVFPIAWPTP